MTRYLNRREAAAYCNERGLKITPAMLGKLAHLGGGPIYCLWGNCAVSTPEQMDEFIAKRLSPPRKATSHDPRRKLPSARPGRPEAITSSGTEDSMKSMTDSNIDSAAGFRKFGRGEPATDRAE